MDNPSFLGSSLGIRPRFQKVFPKVGQSSASRLASMGNEAQYRQSL